VLRQRGVLDNPIKVFAQNGSPSGIPLLKEGSLKYTISSSPGWEGVVAFLALYRHIKGEITETQKHYMLPIISVTPENVEDKTKVVPWEMDPIYWELTKEFFPELVPDLVAAEATPSK
jgi:ribose transport system substrate-binding protein